MVALDIVGQVVLVAVVGRYNQFSMPQGLLFVAQLNV